MPSQMNCLRLEPDDTLFFTKTPGANSPGPNRELKLTNTSQTNVAFKVKTTAPKSYLVRPSSGTLRPKETQTVTIILQPQGNDGPGNVHRFLVQAVATSSSENVGREQWAEFTKDKIQEHRLNVVWEDREEGAGPQALSANTQSQAQAPETYADLKAKYDELLQWSLDVEGRKKQLEGEIARLKEKPSGGAEVKVGFSMLHIILVALVAFSCSYGAQMLTK